MTTPMNITFGHLSRPSGALVLAARILSWPTRLLRAPVDALQRQRTQARAEAALAALDDRLLADIGLRRTPGDHWHSLNGPCG
jgi:uncharacterized protein YjiS (DUF1127 family)